jgi:hypothetical protein
MHLRRQAHVARHGWNPAALWPGAALLLAAVTAPAVATDAPVRRAGAIEAPALIELSGIAVSRRLPGRWWGHNDSGNAAELFAFDGGGRALGSVAVAAPMFDWEDIASYRQDGLAYLAVADTGDNFSLREQLAIQVFAEPGEPLPAELRPLRTIAFRFEDGSRDCEGLAADPAHQRFLLVDKGRHPVGLYALPMAPLPGLAIARRIADLPSLYPETPPLTSPLGAARYRGTPTALDLSADGLRLLVLTYTHLAEFRRRADQDWPEAIRQTPPRLLRLPKAKLLEAAGYDDAAPGALISGETANAPIWRWDGRFPAPRP